MAKVYLVTGGARSGKSRYAENLAKSLCSDAKRRCYIATAEAFDDEMKDRIKKHQDRSNVILVDCLTVWMGNLLYYNRLEETDKLIRALKNAKCPIVLVTNETGMGIVPENELSRQFRDESGFLNQAVAEVADSVVFMVCGLPIFVKGKV